MQGFCVKASSRFTSSQTSSDDDDDDDDDDTLTLMAFVD